MGPTLIVILPAEPGLHELDDLLRASAVDITRTSPSEWEFLLAPSNCMASLSVVPFGSEADGSGGFTESHLEPGEEPAYADALGFRPIASLQLDNYCRSDRAGHVLLGRLAAGLAKRWRGMIELIIAGERPSEWKDMPGLIRRVMLPKRETESVSLDEFMKTWTLSEYVCDDEFMEAWTNSNAYYLEI